MIESNTLYCIKYEAMLKNLNGVNFLTSLCPRCELPLGR